MQLQKARSEAPVWHKGFKMSPYHKNLLIIPFRSPIYEKQRQGIRATENARPFCTSPNIHRAFDRGRVTIDDDYSILLSSHILEKVDHAYSLKKFQGQKIVLPERKAAWPDVDLLKWHRSKVFKG